MAYFGWYYRHYSGVIPGFGDFHENGLQNDEFHGVPLKHLLNRSQ